MMTTLALALALALGAHSPALAAQRPNAQACTLRPLGDAPLGFRADTTTASHVWNNSASKSTEREIYRRYVEFLRGRATGTTPDPSPLWSSVEQRITSGYDVARTFINRGLAARVLRIVPADSTRTIFCIQTVWTGADPLQGSVETLYAIREKGNWVLSGAINFNARSWHRTKFGPITYFYSPTHSFDTVRARHALAFADSLGALFHVPALPPLEYYLTASGDDALALMGIDNYQKYPGAVSAMALPGRIIVGDSVQGENYRHELVHQMLAPLTRDDRTDYLVEEGIAVWLGGTKGMKYDAARRALGAQLRAHPAVSLDSIPFTVEWNHGTVGAVLIQMVFAKRGMAGVRALIGAGKLTSTDKTLFEQALGMPWAEIKRAWWKTATAGVK